MTYIKLFCGQKLYPLKTRAYNFFYSWLNFWYIGIIKHIGGSMKKSLITTKMDEKKTWAVKYLKNASGHRLRMKCYCKI